MRVVGLREVGRKRQDLEFDPAYAVRIPPRVRRWLSGPRSDPSVRYRFFTEVDGRSDRDPKVRAAFRAIGRNGWAASLLAGQWPDGHWITPQTTGRDLYRPKYISTNWMAIVLSDLGLTRTDPRIQKTAELILARWSGRGGDLSGKTGEVCVTGNAVRTLIRFGYLDHPIVQGAIDWLLRDQKADGGWHCFPSRTGTLDGWEALAAFAEIPEDHREERVRRAIERGAEFFLRHRLMKEGRQNYSPWLRIHYPNHYYYDVLVGLRILTRLGYGAEPRLRPAIRWLESKRSRDGTWALDATHPDLDLRLTDYSVQTPLFPMMLEPPGEASQWGTVEALSVLARIERAPELS